MAGPGKCSFTGHEPAMQHHTEKDLSGNRSIGTSDPAPDNLYFRPGIIQAVNECRQNQYAGEVYADASEEKYRRKKNQETEMRNGVGVISFEFLAHGENHSAAKQTDYPLNNDECGIGYSIFFKIPWLQIDKREIGFTQ